MSSVVRQRQSLMFRARSYTGFVIMPRPPIVEWLADLDSSLEQSKGFFAGYPIVVDLSAVTLSTNAIAQLLASLDERNIRVLGIEGLDPAATAPGLPPILRAGRSRSRSSCCRDVERGRRSAGRSRKRNSRIDADRDPDAFRAIGGVPDRRGDRARLGRLGRRDRRRRIDPHLRHAARPRHGGLDGRCPGAHLLQPQRSRAARHRRLLPDRRDMDASLRGRPVQVWLEGETLKLSA